jgi:hypothetical protein
LATVAPTVTAEKFSGNQATAVTAFFCGRRNSAIKSIKNLGMTILGDFKKVTFGASAMITFSHDSILVVEVVAHQR